MTEVDDDIAEVDRLALDRAIQLTLAEDDQGRVEQVRSMLEDRSWGRGRSVLCLTSAGPQPEHQPLGSNTIVDRSRPDRRHHPGRSGQPQVWRREAAEANAVARDLPVRPNAIGINRARQAEPPLTNEAFCWRAWYR